VTFSGSMVAFGKLNGSIPSKAVIFKGQHIINAAFLLIIIVATGCLPRMRRPPTGFS